MKTKFCYLFVICPPLTFVTSRSPRFLWQQQPPRAATTTTRPKFSQGHRCIFADKLRHTKDRECNSPSFLSPRLTPDCNCIKAAAARGRERGTEGEGGKSCESGICKFLGRAGLHKSHVIVAFRNSFPFTLSPREPPPQPPFHSFCRITSCRSFNIGSFNADTKTDVHRYRTGVLALLLRIKESIICVTLPTTLSRDFCGCTGAALFRGDYRLNIFRSCEEYFNKEQDFCDFQSHVCCIKSTLNCVKIICERRKKN